MCGSMSDIQSATAEIRRRKKIDRKKKKPKIFITAVCEQEDKPIRSDLSNIVGFIIIRRVFWFCENEEAN